MCRRDYMTVNIGKSIYEGLSIVQFNELLKIASDAVPFGIYAIERKGVAIMLRKRYKSKPALRKAVKEYMDGGFTVHCNGL